MILELLDNEQEKEKETEIQTERLKEKERKIEREKNCFPNYIFAFPVPLVLSL